MELEKTRWWMIWLFAMFLSLLGSRGIPAWIPPIFYVAAIFQLYRQWKQKRKK
jgi:hypothetical protein